MGNDKRELILKLREETGCGLMDAARAFDLRDGVYELMKEYIERTGLAVAFRGTPEHQEAMRYPKWAAYQEARKKEIRSQIKSPKFHLW